MATGKFIPKTTRIAYRGKIYKIEDVKTMKVNGINITLLKLPNDVFDMWVNSDYTICC